METNRPVLLFFCFSAFSTVALPVHSIPVILTVFFIGIVIDKFGTQRTAVFLSAVSLVGALCVATGHRHFGILVLGRLLFGFGAESMSVTAQKMLAHRYRDSMLSLAFGFQIFWGQLGSCVVFVIMPILNEKLGTIAALWTVPIIGVTSLATTLMYYWIDVKGEQEVRKRSSPPVSPTNSMSDDPIALDDEESLSESVNLDFQATSSFRRRRRGLTDSPSPSDMVASSPSPPQSFDFVEEEDGGVDLKGAVVMEGQVDKFELKDLKTFPLAFWVLLALYFSVSTTFFVWNSFGGDRLREKYDYKPKEAGMVVALSNLAAMVSPLTGFIVDRIGHRTKFIISGSALMLLTYCAITWTNVLPTMWYVLLGIGVSLSQPIVFSSVSLVVKDTITGTAFALMSLAMNIGQVAMPAMVGHMRAKSGSYQSSNYAFVALALLAVLLSTLLFVLERSMNILDTIGLWRGTAPPSVYNQLSYASSPPPAIPANLNNIINSEEEDEPTPNITNEDNPLDPSESQNIPFLIHSLQTPRNVDEQDLETFPMDTSRETDEETPHFHLDSSSSHLIQEGSI